MAIRLWKASTARISQKIALASPSQSVPALGASAGGMASLVSFMAMIGSLALTLCSFYPRRGNDDERLRERMIVGHGQMDMRAWPSGVMASSLCFAPPVSASVGAPDGWLTTPMSCMNTPRLKPVPTALEKASLAAKRLA